jgi:hypothetical protein
MPASFWAAVIFLVLTAMNLTWLAWWMFFSPTPDKTKPRAHVQAGRPGYSPLWPGMAGLAYLVGALTLAQLDWIKVPTPIYSESSWFAHIYLFASLGITAVVGLNAMRNLRSSWRETGLREPRRQIREDVWRGVAALLSVASVLAAAGDWTWHLTGAEWPAPHLLMGVTAASAAIAAGTWQARSARIGGWRQDFTAIILLAIGLNAIYALILMPWEAPLPLSGIAGRLPIWIYPVIGGGMAFAGLMLTKRLVDWRWGATAAAFLFFAVRLLITLLLAILHTLLPLPNLPLVFLGGAIVLDWLPLGQINARWVRLGAMAAVFTFAYVVTAIPALEARVDLPRFTGSDVAWTLIATAAFCLMLTPVFVWVLPNGIPTGRPRRQ